MARRTARQRAASRRNLVKARRSRKRRVIRGAAVVTGVAMGAATGVYAVDRTRNVRLYHATSRDAAHSIAKTGFRASSHDIGSGRVQTSNEVYFSKRKPNRHQRINYGDTTVRVKMRRKALKGSLHRDLNHGRKRYYHANRNVVNKGNITVLKSRKR